MRISSFHPLNKEAPYDAKVAGALNSILREHTEALSKQLSFRDNFNAQIKTLRLYEDTEVTVQAEALRGVPIGCILLWSELDDYAHLKWTPVAAGKLKVTVKWDTAPTDPYDVRILILGD